MQQMRFDINGQQIAVISDFIGDVATIETDTQTYALIQELSQIKARCYVNEGELQEVRAQYPGVAVYGLWQILIHSGVIHEEGDYFIADRDNPNNGQFLRVVDVDGKPVAHGSTPVIGGLVKFSGASIDFATPINLEQVDLSIPEFQCRLMLEISKQHRDRLRAGWTFTGVCCLFVALLGAAFWYVDYRNIESIKFEAQQLDVQNKRLLDEIRFLNTTRVPKVKTYRHTIDTLTMIKSIDPGAKTFKEPGKDDAIRNTFETGQFVLISSKGFQHNVFREIGVVDARYSPNGSYVIKVINRVN